MNNFAEELTYWYLRFNGFFLLSNFVLHCLGHENQRGTADFDLLAIRFPYVYEKVGGQTKDWDKERFSSWGLNIDENSLAFMVEVKSGRSVRKNEIERAFTSERLEKALYRFGIFTREEVLRVAKELESQKYIEESSWVIAKLAVTEKEIRGSWLNLTLNEVDKFIRKRIEYYSKDKYLDRIYFQIFLCNT
ncbi:hypothetical protein H0A61_00266 [Koleobacter methoxysyntrophicus]|uniref:Uncharacterized protein n=1 Tax=Koleobacter methoxysyntrophicus TaxID=2751313 RepID=A0A8A0RKC6_9FIRM|nr:hypothetical protein [Koleobacter methoxysyntrophicus]QSQ07947.1 hypothetical protein H0A61_00266 [Koleobacter methoxysyntrophicus]